VKELIMPSFRDLFKREPKPGLPHPVNDEDFQQEVLESEIPVVMDCFSRTCPPCHVMGGLLEEIGPQYGDRVKIVKLNVESNPETTQRFRIRSVPTLIFFKRGKPVQQIVGLIPLDQLQQVIEKILV
jgi:thioredoxin 1